MRARRYSGGSRWLAVAAGGLVVALVASRIRLLAVFSGSWTDEDQTLLWAAARELRSLRAHEPYFYGQPYGSWLEALVAVPLSVVGVPMRLAVPIGGAVFGLAPWLGFASVAWWGRRSAVAAIGIVAAALVMSVEGTIVTTMPRGLLPGVVLACVGACIVVTWPRAVVALGSFGFLAVIAASMNVSSALVSAPVGAWLGLSLLRIPNGRLRSWGALGLGVVAGGVGHAAGQRFYAVHPDSLVHQAPAIDWSAARALDNLGHLGRYLTAFGPEAARSWVVVVAVVAAVAGWVVVSRRSLEVTAAVVVGLGLSLAILGAAKANDGTASIFFPFSRIALALPWMVCAFVVLPSRRRPPVDASRRAVLASGLVLAGVALVGAGVREVDLVGRVHQLTEAAVGQPPVGAVRTADVDHRCEVRRAAARRYDVDVVLDRYDRSATYGCAAMLGPPTMTFHPEYDRRTWVHHDARRRSVPRVLVSGLDTCPPDPLTCRVVDGAEPLHLIAGPRRPVTAWASDLGLTVRPLQE